MDALVTIIRRFDSWLSRVEGVKPFTDDPLVFLRIQDARAAWDIPLPDKPVCKGSPVLLIHLWNQRMPVIPSAGADLAWALESQRRFLHSLRAVALHIAETASLADVEGIGGIIAQIQLSGSDGGRLMFERLGFKIFPYHRPAGKFGEFWENVFTWALMWAYNPASLRSHRLLEMQRNEFWITKEEFLVRFLKP